jgi:hypothetical protein
MRSSLSLNIATFALAIGAQSSFANAAVVDEAATAMAKEKMAACKMEYGSLRDMCAAAAGYGMVMRQDFSPEQLRALNDLDARYEAAVAQCRTLPDSSRPICVSRAATPSMLTGTAPARD